MMLAKSLQSAAGNAAGEANYIEDVFSTYLYTGNGSTQNINNGISLGGNIEIAGFVTGDGGTSPIVETTNSTTDPSDNIYTATTVYRADGLTLTRVQKWSKNFQAVLWKKDLYFSLAEGIKSGKLFYTQNGNLYVCCSYGGSNYGLINRINPATGDIIWSKYTVSTSSTVQSIAEDSTGTYVYVVSDGYTASVGTGTTTGILSKLSVSTGGQSFHKAVYVTTDETQKLYGCVVLGDYIYVCGYVQSGVNELPAIAKFDTSGNLIASRTLYRAAITGSSTFFRIQTDGTSLYVCGYQSGYGSLFCKLDANLGIVWNTATITNSDTKIATDFLLTDTHAYLIARSASGSEPGFFIIKCSLSTGVASNSYYIRTVTSGSESFLTLQNGDSKQIITYSGVYNAYSYATLQFDVTDIANLRPSKYMAGVSAATISNNSTFSTSTSSFSTANNTNSWSSRTILIDTSNAFIRYSEADYSPAIEGNGGLVWQKNRGSAIKHWLYDSAQSGALVTNATDAAYTANDDVDFTSTGFITKYLSGNVNLNGANYASWTFRKQPKFFDVVTWTGDSVAGRQIPHNLGSAPGAVFIKCTSNPRNWRVWHRSLTTAQSMVLNSTTSVTSTDILNSTAPTSTTLTLSADPDVNNSSFTYVAYLFAHNAGGFGESGEENVISCGSVTDNNRVELGYEPQFLLMKKVNDTTNWILVDSMRGLTADTNLGNSTLFPNTSGAEASGARYANIDATGFTSNMGAPGTHIYIAIRRGPMKTPTTGTSVFNATLNAAATNTKITTGFVPDTQIMMFPPSAGNEPKFYDRLRGVNTTGVDVITQFLQGASTAAEASNIAYTRYWQNDGYQISSAFGSNQWVYWTFGRAPGFMDVVCYTGTGVARTVAHNLGVVPELMIVKCRNAAGSWWTYHVAVGNGAAVRINADSAPTVSSTFWNSTTPTDTVFSLGTHLDINGSGETNVAYLFASCPGVSKVGSYTGTGTTQQINCGFTGGARFVLIKRTDSTGAWYVWDSARGIVAGNDPYLLLNSTAAEVTSTDYIDPVSSGFEISSTAPAAINASGGTFIYLAIA